MVESADVRWFEEPVSSDDVDGLRRVRDRFEGEVAAGEYGYTLDYFKGMIGARAVDCLQADVTRCGGYSVWLKIAALAEANHLDVSAHCAPNLHVPVAAAVNNLRHIEYFHDHHRIETTLFEGSLSPQGGTMQPDRSRPGHGLATTRRRGRRLPKSMRSTVLHDQFLSLRHYQESLTSARAERFSV